MALNSPSEFQTLCSVAGSGSLSSAHAPLGSPALNPFKLTYLWQCSMAACSRAYLRAALAELVTTICAWLCLWHCQSCNVM